MLQRTDLDATDSFEDLGRRFGYEETLEDQKKL